MMSANTPPVGCCRCCVGSGNKSYFVEGRVKGSGVNLRVTLGKHKKLTPELARREAKRIIADIAIGIDALIAAADNKNRPHVIPRH
jgi:hypothetical protein